MFIKTFIIAFILYIALDAPYLYLNQSLFKKYINKISGKGATDRYYSAIMVYIALALGISVLAVPRIRNGTLVNRISDSLMFGGVFGLVSYATYDFTVHFMFEGWDLQVALMDTIWGGILSTLVALLTSYLV